MCLCLCFILHRLQFSEAICLHLARFAFVRRDGTRYLLQKQKIFSGKLPLHPRYKIMILTRYVCSTLRWTLTIYEFPLTWLKQNLDSSVLYYVRRWLQFHPGAHTTPLTLPSKYLGAGVSLISDLFEKCQLLRRTLLKRSSHADIKKLYYLTSDKHRSSNEIMNLSPRHLREKDKNQCGMCSTFSHTKALALIHSNNKICPGCPFSKQIKQVLIILA